MPLLPRRTAWLALILFSGGAASAQENVGAAKCGSCHKTGKRAWQESHAQTLAQLSEPRATDYAKATGGNTNAPKCLACHAPVAMAAGPAAVSCETCHGAGKAYLAPHQELAFYSRPPAEWMGLRDLQRNPKEIARICVSCHVLDDAAIAAAGHPVGATFDAGRALAGAKMAHWPSGTVNETRVRAHGPPFYAAVSREGAPLVASRASKVAGRTAPAVIAKPARPAPVAAPAASDEYADLADDEFVATAAVADPPSGAFATPPVRLAPRPAPPPPPPPLVAARPSPGAESPPPPPPSAAKPLGIAELRGRAALVLADLIRQKKTLDIPAPAPPAEFAGPDGELLRLQDEALALALLTLRKAP